MSYGLEIRNSDNNVIIDGSLPNLLVRGFGTTGFGGIAGTGYAPPNGPGDGSDGYIPNSGISYNGNVLGSDILFGVPYSSSGFASNAEVHLEGNMQVGAIVTRLSRKWGRNEASFGATPSPKPPQYKWFQLAGSNQNGFPVQQSSSTDYGFEVYDGNGVVVFTTTILTSFGTIQGVVVTTGGNGTYSTGGDTFAGAHTATFIAPVGEDIYDYYVSFNDFDYDNNTVPANSQRAVKAVYRNSTRSIVLISSYTPKTFIIAKFTS